ncbi:MAG: VCBS repeat-containing protein, partial [Gammaproteobacteria bacterium]|nr:VCBS repeat-containing protein [Gammaproteobacteria bacterium]
MIYRILKLFFVAAIIPVGIFIQSCSSSSSGGNEDRARPAVTLSGIVDTNNADNQVIGEATLQWITDDSNPSTVDIYLSRDSGSTFTLIANDRPDIGAYTFDTNTVDDCRQCRVRIIARDIVGNVSDAADSAQDFIINNVPQVLGAAVYYDPDSNGPDDGDTIVVPFDKDLELRTGIASDIFILPVLGDSIGPFATVARGAHSNELVITMNGLVTFNGHLHIGKVFDPQRLHRTAPSGFNVRDNLSGGILFAPDTGRTAAAAEGIDIAPAFADSGQAIGSGTTTSVVLADVDADGDQDMVEATTANINVWLNNGNGIFPGSANQAIVVTSTSTIALGDVDGDGYLDIVAGRNSYQPNLVYSNNGAGVFANSGQSLGAAFTSSIVLGDIDADNDLDMVEGVFGGANRVWRNNGSGIFADSGQALGSDNTNAIVLGDVDGDTDLDLIEGNQNQPKHVWR